MPARRRTNFPKAIRKAALERSLDRSGHRSVYRCEGIVDGERCRCELIVGHYVFDHVVTDFHGGRATLENCQVLCKDCDRAKTAADQAAIADTRRAFDAHHRLSAPRRPMDGGRYSPLAKGFDRITRDRATGEVRSNPSSIDVRDL